MTTNKRLTHLLDPGASGLTCCGLPLRRRSWVTWYEDCPETCNPCVQKYPRAMWQASAGMRILGEWLQWMEALGSYCRCRLCNAKVTDALFWQALAKHEQQLCSDTCRVNELKQRYACCMEAERSPCVCSYSFDCKTHGATHIGTHD